MNGFTQGLLAGIATFRKRSITKQQPDFIPFQAGVQFALRSQPSLPLCSVIIVITGNMKIVERHCVSPTQH